MMPPGMVFIIGRAAWECERKDSGLESDAELRSGAQAFLTAPLPVSVSPLHPPGTVYREAGKSRTGRKKPDGWFMAGMA